MKEGWGKGARGGREGGSGGREGERGGREGEIGGKGGKFEISTKNNAGGGSSRNRSSHPASKSTRQGSNLRPGDLQSLALPLSYWWLTRYVERKQQVKTTHSQSYINVNQQ